jgi:hypothetical protein
VDITFWFLHPWVWDGSVAASISTVVTSMGGKAGRENCFKFAEKVPPKAGHFLVFFDGTCLNTTSSSALREHDVLVSSSVDMGYRSVSACVSMVATMDGKAGRENCCTLAEKALPKVGQTKYRLFQRNMFTHNLLQRSA